MDIDANKAFNKMEDSSSQEKPKFLDRKGQVIGLAPFDGKQSAHSVVYAKSGAGKTFEKELSQEMKPRAMRTSKLELKERKIT